MFAHIAQQLDGWWGGALHPFDGSAPFIAMVAVGLLLGVAASAGSDPWVGSIGYMVGLLGGHAIGAAGVRPTGISAVVVAAVVVTAALLLVDPPRIRHSLPVLALVIGALAGLRLGGHDQRNSGGWFTLGLAFTSVVLLSCTVVLGTQVGRSVAARRIAAAVASLAAVGIALS